MNSISEPLLICSLLLRYPDEELLDVLREVEIDRLPGSVREHIRRFLEFALSNPTLLQEIYVSTFDMSPENALYVTYHLYGNDISRGFALLQLKQIYRSAGFDPVTNELPDYLPMLLEFISLSNNREAVPLISKYIPYLERSAKRLEETKNPYAPVLRACLESLRIFRGG